MTQVEFDKAVERRGARERLELRAMLQTALARNETLAHELGEAKAGMRILAQIVDLRSTSRPRRGTLTWLKGLIFGPGR